MIALMGTLVLATAFLPWFRTRWAVGLATDEHEETRNATAWQASSWWSLAVLLCVVAAALHVAARLRVRWPAFGLTAIALAVTAWQWLALTWLPVSGPGGWFAADPAGAAGVGEIVRDQLAVVHVDGLSQDVGWGLYAGIAAMTGLLMALATPGADETLTAAARV